HRWGLLKQKLGDVEAARAHFERALETAASVGFRAHEVSALCDLGNALRRLVRPTEAAAAYERAADGGRALGLRVITSYARFNAAICRLEEGHPLEALTIFQGALLEDVAARNAVAASLDAFWCTLTLQHLGRYPEALEAADKALSQLDKVSEPEVLHDLLVVLSDLLLLTGQEGRLRHVLERLRATPWPDLEADDRIMEAAVRAAAAKRGLGAFSDLDRKKAVDLLETATPCGRAFWHLLSAGAGGDARGALETAWAEARSAGSHHLSCRALLALARAGDMPRLEAEVQENLRTYLTANRVRGPERDLLSILEAPPDPRPAPEEFPLSEMALLASAESGEEGALERLAAYLGGPVCLSSPGDPPRFAGDADPDSRRVLLAGRGRTGPVQEDGTSLVGAQDPSGRWVGCAFRPGRYVPGEPETLLRLWLKLLPIRSPAPHRPPPVLPKAFEGILLTRSPAMAPPLDLLARAAAFTFPVLLTGEPGTGKEIFAQALHHASARGRKAWVPANCANLSSTLAASLLFGHRKGAFTGADRDQGGLVEAARDSTLFLDEVGELPAEVQAALLRFLQDGSFLPVGEVRPRHSTARVVAATNRDLEEAVSQGAFRADLLHRLNVIRVEIPPLRRRTEDVALLFEHFLTRAADAENVPCPPVDPEVLSRLEAYRWPGNVRELQNTARALLVASRGEERIQPRHLPARIAEGGAPVPGDGLTLAHSLRRAEAAAIRSALDACGGSPSEAARRLGISRQGLYEKTRRLGLRGEPR
ncbi:MAG: sigma-54 dependent transcriptional regulator, partial [Acidobacteriota bacterium]